MCRRLRNAWWTLSTCNKRVHGCQASNKAVSTDPLQTEVVWSEWLWIENASFQCLVSPQHVWSLPLAERSLAATCPLCPCNISCSPRNISCIHLPHAGCRMCSGRVSEGCVSDRVLPHYSHDHTCPDGHETRCASVHRGPVDIGLWYDISSYRSTNNNIIFRFPWQNVFHFKMTLISCPAKIHDADLTHIRSCPSSRYLWAG